MLLGLILLYAGTCLGQTTYTPPNQTSHTPHNQTTHKPHCPASSHCSHHGPAVCGSDLTTYKNMCYLNVSKCHALQHSQVITLLHSGQCTTLDKFGHHCDQICDEEGVTKYCLSNGKTYDSNCDVQNAQCNAARHHDHLTVVHAGPCLTLNSTYCHHVNNCPTYHRYLCATNGYTYKNECYLKSAQCRLVMTHNMTQTIGILHTGMCHDTSTDQSRNIDCSQFADMSYAGLAVEGLKVQIQACNDTSHAARLCADGVTYKGECSFCNRMASTRKITYSQLNIPIGHDGPCVHSPLVG